MREELIDTEDVMNAALDEVEDLRAKLAAAERDIEDLAFCEECGITSGKMPEPVAYPPRYCHGCWQSLIKRAETAERERDDARLVLKNANEHIRSLFGELDEVEKERDKARTALEAARQM